MREKLEQHQVWIYLTTILLGMLIGWQLPGTTQAWDLLLWPMLGALLVLLVPCTDWFISFTHLGKGDTHRAIAASPTLLLLQLMLLPFYIWLFMGLFMDEEIIQLTLGSHLVTAFAGLILLPLLLAWMTERAAEKNHSAKQLVTNLGWLPVPLLAVVVFLIAASQINAVLDTTVSLGPVLVVFLLYLLAAALVGKLLSHLLGLKATSARTLIFSLGTRNSFVVLPLALALPELWSSVVVIIVFQSLVELFGMTAYLRWVPSHLARDHGSGITQPFRAASESNLHHPLLLFDHNNNEDATV